MIHYRLFPTYGRQLSAEQNISSESNKREVSNESLETENSDGLSEPPYILPSKSSLSPSQKKIVEEKVQAIQSEIPIYVSIMKKSNIGAIRHHMLVSCTYFFIFSFYVLKRTCQETCFSLTFILQL